MLDKRMQMMLEAANTLTADDLETIRGLAPASGAALVTEEAGTPVVQQTAETDGASADQGAAEPAEAGGRPARQSRRRRAHRSSSTAGSTVPRGEYERQRTRESKVSTTCVGHEREKHDWWPVGTDLIGRIGSEVFTATVVENLQVKSGRSVLITSGAASGKVCLTPTRAAIEATESYRQANNLGRGGGVTNGWQFWQPNA